MALSTPHPDYVDVLPDWRKARDFSKGEREVKNKGQLYLPATTSMNLDGFGYDGKGQPKLGQMAYDAYKLRAVFPEYMKDAITIFMGMLHNKDAVIELPEALEPLRAKATELGEPLLVLLQRINQEQLTTGRIGLLADLPKVPDPANPLPYIAIYIAEAVINWDDDRIGDNRAVANMVVLDETGYKRQRGQFDWKTHKKFRVLELTWNETTETYGAPYKQGVFEEGVLTGTDYDESAMKAPHIRGKELDEIPFVCINATDIGFTVYDPPLMPLANACSTIYRGEADYRQNLFMQGQDTLVIIGTRRKDNQFDAGAEIAEDAVRTGAGSRIEMEPEQGADVKYVGVTSSGLAEQRNALENDRKRAESKSGQLIDAAKGDKESGTALKTRVGAQTASLNQIAKIGALGLEMILKQIAKWTGANPDEVKVTPNLEFSDFQMSGQDLSNLMTAKEQGAPMSNQSVHRLMVQGNLTTLDYETEKSILESEPPLPAEQKRQDDLELAKEAAKNKALPAPGDQNKPQTQGPAPKAPVDGS